MSAVLYKGGSVVCGWCRRMKLKRTNRHDEDYLVCPVCDVAARRGVS